MFSDLSGGPAAFVFSFLVALLDILGGCTRATAAVKKKKEKRTERRWNESSTFATI
jgi:hypothetical protein